MRKLLALFVLIISVALTIAVSKYVQNRKSSQNIQAFDLNTIIAVTNNSSFLENESEIIVEMPEDFLNYLLQYISKDLDCDTMSPIESPYDLRIEKTDLNNDQKLEFIVYPWEICGKSMRTATGNGLILVLMQINNEWNIVGQLYGTTYQLEDTFSNEFRDIITMTHESYEDRRFSTYEWHEDKDQKLSGYVLQSEKFVVLNADKVWELDEIIPEHKNY